MRLINRLEIEQEALRLSNKLSFSFKLRTSFEAEQQALRQSKKFEQEAEVE